MKKRLLTLALVMLGAVSSFAYEVGESVYTTTGRVKILGENVITNSTFAEGTEGWYGATTSESPLADVWSVEDGLGPNGESVVKVSLAAGLSGGLPLCGFWGEEDGIEPGETYVVSFDIKGEGDGATSVTSGGTNYADIFINSDFSFAKAEGATSVATVANFSTEWKTIAFTTSIEQGQYIVFHFEKMTQGIMLTNMAIQKAQVVYDDRIVKARLAFAKQLLDDPNFNTEEAKEAHDNLTENIIPGIEGAMEAGMFDDASAAEEAMNSFNEELNAYLDVTSQDMTSTLTTLDFANLGEYGRGRYTGAANLELAGGNWGHPSGVDYLMSAIQTGMSNNTHTATLTVKSEDFPAGKYFITAEIRNANTGKSSWPCPEQTFNLSTQCQMFIGTDSVEIGPVVGEEYQRFYLVSELTGDEAFRAGFYWPGPGMSKGGAFYIKNVTVRAFGDIQAKIERKQIWDAFKAQWNAAVNGRNSVVEKIGNKYFPWEQDTLKNCLNHFDPYYNDVVNKGWVAADGSDAGVATNDELSDWTKYQGAEIPEDGKATYFLVRGYQYTNNYVVAANAAISNLLGAINNAKATMANDLYSNGDKNTLQAAIDVAQAKLDEILADATDASREADEAVLNAAREELNAAIDKFKKEGEITPVVDIDFSNGFTELTDAEGNPSGSYVIKGAKGEVAVGTATNAAGDNKDGQVFDLGYGEELKEVLRIGNGTATVEFDEAALPTEEDVIRVTFDTWFGRLLNRYMFFDLRNASDARVAGFRFSPYDYTVDYNDFNRDGEGMPLTSEYINAVTTGDAGACVDNNKTSFDLIVDYKAQEIKATVNGKKVFEGKAQTWPNLADAQIAKFAFGSNYNSAPARRSWFDNLKIYKYASSFDPTGVATVKTKTVAPAAIYNLAGQKLNSVPAKGIYIQNGKKYVVK